MTASKQAIFPTNNPRHECREPNPPETDDPRFPDAGTESDGVVLLASPVYQDLGEDHEFD